MKICVYGICKNEEKFVKRCIESVKDADYIVMCDTGSTDNTVSLLKEYGVIVHQVTIMPWRFDKARNVALSLIPDDTDVCVSIDLDEVLSNNWRNELEAVWKLGNTTNLYYPYVWEYDENNNPSVEFYYNKIHSLKGYEWKYPIHEVLNPLKDFKECRAKTDKIVLSHYPDTTKPRQYITLLEENARLFPTDPRTVHYLGREYYYHQRWNECIDTLLGYLVMPNATWPCERSFSHKYISTAYRHLDRFEDATMHCMLAISEAPHLREPYIELAYIGYDLEKWILVKWACEQALRIECKDQTYHNEKNAWDSTPYDLLSIACYHLEQYEKAVEAVTIALEYSPNNERLKNNLHIYSSKLR